MFTLVISVFLLCGGIKAEFLSKYGIEKSDEQWRRLLSRERYCVMRKKATEPAFSGKYLHWEKKGLFLCAACGLQIFHSSSKFDAHNGWPAFSRPIVQKHVWIKEDHSLPFLRYEVLCRGCDSHLGHLFKERGGSFRYTINSIAIEFCEEPSGEH